MQETLYNVHIDMVTEPNIAVNYSIFHGKRLETKNNTNIYLQGDMCVSLLFIRRFIISC